MPGAHNIPGLLWHPYEDGAASKYGFDVDSFRIQVEVNEVHIEVEE
jgi:hypothetical protein